MTAAMAGPVAISCGDPAGIGPEVTAKAWSELRGDAPMLWLGDPAHLPQDVPFEVISDAGEAAAVSARALPVMPVDFAAPAQPGKEDTANAAGVIASIEQAVALVQSGAASAVCTAPINKRVLQDGAGFPHPGHTEFLAALAGCDNVVMMLACDALRVVPTTIHIPLEEVPGALTPDLLRATIEITVAALRRDFGIKAPRIAVAGLNPHAGEGGKMGRQEGAWIAPLIATMVAEGFDLSGPLPADTMFHARARAQYDTAVCMYHDQALIPIKTIDFDGGVNVTLGLPFVRTSPDHGTAFDIAGRGIANPGSMIAAIRAAHHMAERRR